MPRYKYEADTPAKDVIREFKKLLPADGSCARDEVLALHQPTVLAHGTAMDMAHAVPHEHWAMWDLMILGKDTAPDIRKVLINKITSHSLAFMLYLKAAWLTDDEDKLLEAKFAGKLPTAAESLAYGVIVRAKKV